MLQGVLYPLTYSGVILNEKILSITNCVLLVVARMLKNLFQFIFFQTWADFVDRVWDSGGACENGGVVRVLDVRVVLAYRAAVRAADGEDATNAKTEKKSSF